MIQTLYKKHKKACLITMGILIALIIGLYLSAWSEVYILSKTYKGLTAKLLHFAEALILFRQSVSFFVKYR